MATAKKGDRVRINFTGILEDGTIFDTTYADDCSVDDCTDDDCGCETGPMEITIGEEEFFVLVEQELIGMSPGEKKTIIVPPEEAFGEYDEENILTLERDQFPDDLVPAVDMDLELSDEDGDSFVATVIELDEKTVTLDANHPLAGETLTFDVELIDILNTVH